VIAGIGIDVVAIDRFAQSLDRTPMMNEKLFTSVERSLPLASKAARFAAKEALAKALNARYVFAWHECEVVNESTGKPIFNFYGELAERLSNCTVHLSLSHDAGIASAMVIVEQA
jgi:holo-[acyl-carrier protein] synthase